MDCERLRGFPEEFRGIKFYPLHLYEDDIYTLMLQLLGISKNAIADVRVVKMSYLRFILFCLNVKDIEPSLCKLISHVTHEKVKVGFMVRKDAPIINGSYSLDSVKRVVLFIGDKQFTESDFEKIREIILEQNGVSLKRINEYNPQLEEALIYYQKRQDPVEFEDEIIAFSIYMHKFLDEVLNQTFYQVKKQMQRINMKEQYELFKPLEVSGQISFKDGGHIESWLAHIDDKNRYSDIQMGLKEFTEKNDFMKVAKPKK